MARKFTVQPQFQQQFQADVFRKEKKKIKKKNQMLGNYLVKKDKYLAA